MADTTTTASPGNRFRRAYNRLKDSLKKKLKSSKRSSGQEQEQPAQGQSGQQPITSTIAAAPAAQAPSHTQSTGPAGSEIHAGTNGRFVFRTTLDPARVKAMFDKYGIEFDGESVVVSHVDDFGERVEKPIRMRVRRICHHCSIPLPRTLVCRQCEHRYCKDCTRYPPRKHKATGRVEEEGTDVVDKPS